MDIAAGGNMAARPKMLMCYLCGREYGTKSLPIHLPQCQKKWLDEENKKPKKERRPLPKPPVEIPIGPGAQSVDEFNEMMYSHWEKETLEKCQFCGRTFRPEALRIHHKSCTADKPAKPAGTGLTAASLSHNLPPASISGTKHAPPPRDGHRGAEATPGGGHVAKSAAATSASSSSPAAGAGPRAAKAGSRVAPVPAATGSGSPHPTTSNSGRDKHPKAPSLDTSSLKAAIDDVGSAGASPSPGSKTSTPNGLPKFCDECGTPYARETSKFCAECGCRRPGSA